MIRRIINRIRRPEPSKTPTLFAPGQMPTVKGRPTTSCGASSRRGRTKRPMGMVRLERRAASRRARASRRANR